MFKKIKYIGLQENKHHQKQFHGNEPKRSICFKGQCDVQITYIEILGDELLIIVRVTNVSYL